MNPNFSGAPSQNIQKPTDIEREPYLDLINDFGVFISLNAVALDTQIIPGKEKELLELRQVLRKPVINGQTFTEFLSNNHQSLTKPQVAEALISQIYNFLLYIEPGLSIFTTDAAWPKRFNVIKEKYSKLVRA